MYMADDHNEQLVEYCSSPDFDISQVIKTKRENQNQENFTKYENLDYDLLID